jgi:hypothetical protein
MAEDSQDFNQNNTIRAKIIKFEYWSIDNF